MSAAVDMTRLPGWPRLLTRARAAAYLGGVSTDQVDDWRREGLIPGYVPGTKMFDRNAIDRRLDELSGLGKAAPSAGGWRA